MDLGLKEFGSTIAVGAYLVLGVAVIVSLTVGRTSVRLLLRRIQWNGQKWLSASIATLVCLGAGIVIEDASDDYLSTKSQPHDAVFNWFLVPETNLKANALFKSIAKTTSVWDSLLQYFDLASVEGVTPWGDLSGLGKTVSESKGLESVPGVTSLSPDGPKDAVAAIAASIYHVAKAEVMKIDSYAAELARIQTRINFTRSVILTTTLLIYLSLLLCGAMWISSVGRWSRWPVVSWILAMGITIAISVWCPWTWCRVVFTLLSALFVFVPLLKAPLMSLRKSGAETPKSNEKKKEEQERKAKDARRWTSNLWKQTRSLLGACAILLMVLVVSVRAFTFEESQFNARVYGYWAVSTGLRESVASIPVGVSGMAKIDGDKNAYVVVHDTKSHQVGPRLGVVTLLKEGGQSYEPVVTDWGQLGRMPNDLEGIHGIPGEPGCFFMCESGPLRDKDGHLMKHNDGRLKDRGRVIRIRLLEDQGAWKCIVLNVLKLPDDACNIEGIAYVNDGEQRLLLLGERAPVNENHQAPWTVKVHVIRLNSDFKREEQDQSIGFVARWPSGSYKVENCPRPNETPEEVLPSLRVCSDLYFHSAKQENDKKNILGVLWIASAIEHDGGPYDSRIFRTPLRRAHLGENGALMTIDLDNEVSFRPIPGFKVEALAAPYSQSHLLVFGTDEDSYGGVVRLLPKSR